MNKQEVIDGNKLIAEFMGILVDPKDKTRTSVHFGSKPLQYHSSWDWLMPVVEKIEGLKSVEKWLIEIVAGDCYLTTNNSGEYFKHIGNIKIESVYSVVIQFIQFYNTQPNHNESNTNPR